MKRLCYMESLDYADQLLGVVILCQYDTLTVCYVRKILHHEYRSLLMSLVGCLENDCIGEWSFM